MDNSELAKFICDSLKKKTDPINFLSNVKDIDHANPVTECLKKFDVEFDTIDYRYITVHYNTILHIAQLIRKYNLGEIMKSRKTTGELRMFFVSNLEKIDRDISGNTVVDFMA